MIPVESWLAFAAASAVLLVIPGPTILTVIMLPLLVFMYVRLAHAEERDAQREFGDAYREYAAATPRWVPHLSGRRAANAH